MFFFVFSKQWNCQLLPFLNKVTICQKSLRTFGCVAMGSALLFIVRCRVWCAQSASCFVQVKSLCMYGCMYFFAALVLVDVIVMSSA